MVMHPFQSSLNGKTLKNYKDSNGIYLFQNIVKKINEKGEGFIHYSWPKPNNDLPQAKISFVKSLHLLIFLIYTIGFSIL